MHETKKENKNANLSNIIKEIRKILKTNSTTHIVSFARYIDLFVENREIFIPHLYLAPPQGVTPSEFREDV